MYCSIHTNIHPMLGVDWHMGTPAIPLPPPVPMPHFVAQVLGGFMTHSVKYEPTVLSHNFMVLNRATDIGSGIGHVAPNIFFPILVLTSSSVSEFGAFSVQTGGVSTAIALGVYVGINLNCADPIPGASINGVIAPGCNLANFTLADFGASMLSVGVDLVINAAVNFVGGAMVRGAIGGIASLAGKVSVSAGLTVALVASSKVGQLVTEEVIEPLFGLVTGGPFGSSIGPAPLNWFGDSTDNAIEGMMRDHYEQGESMN